MIFMTSNLGAADMSAMLKPGMGFTPKGVEVDDKLAAKWKELGLTPAVLARLRGAG